MKSSDPLHWIDAQNQEQVQWLEGRINSVRSKYPDSFQGRDQMKNLADWCRNNAWAQLELEKWRKSWDQKRRRAKKPSMKQVNVTMERSLLAELKKLAAHRRATNTQVVRQLIDDAARQMRDEKAKDRARRKDYHTNLQKLEAKNDERLRLYSEAIADLSRELEKLLPNACRAELLMSSEGDGVWVSEDEVMALVSEKIKAIQERLVDANMARLLRFKDPLASEDDSDAS